MDPLLPQYGESLGCVRKSSCPYRESVCDSRWEVVSKFGCVRGAYNFTV